MKTIDKVLKQLNQDARTRDNDNLLIAKIWYLEYRQKSDDSDLINFFIKLSDNEISSAESIRRCRQKLQEEYPGLRGKSYSVRHKSNHEKFFK